MDIHLEKIGVPEFVTEPCSEAQELPRKPDVQFEWHLGANLPKLQTDPRKLKIALKNLLDNAFKFTQQGRVVLRARPSKGGVEFAVTDTGVGIRAEALSVIFEPYRQVDGSDARRYGGVRLGLHIAKRLVELLGGAIAVQSTAERGSTFRVWVPRQHQAPVRDADGATPPWTRNARGKAAATGTAAAGARAPRHTLGQTAPRAVPHFSTRRLSRATEPR